MVRSKRNDLVEGIVLGLLQQRMSNCKIVKQVKQIGYSVSVATIHHRSIQYVKGAIRENIRK